MLFKAEAIAAKEKKSRAQEVVGGPSIKADRELPLPQHNSGDL